MKLMLSGYLQSLIYNLEGAFSLLFIYLERISPQLCELLWIQNKNPQLSKTVKAFGLDLLQVIICQDQDL